MTFLNPLLLFALAAAAIPIILHLLNLRKSRVIDFSTLAFLKELQRSKIRKLKIRQWILLALRTLVIILAVLAFTRPAVRGTYSFLPGTKARSSVILILDDSYSMDASDDEGQLLKQAKAKARAVLDMLKPGDEAALIRLSDARSENRQFTVAIDAVRKELAAADISYAHVPLADALTAAASLLAKSSNVNREVYVITDEQRSHLHAEGAARMHALFDKTVKLFLFPLGAGVVENTAVADVVVENVLLEKGKPVDISATVTNGGDSPVSNGFISLFLGGERVAQSTVDVPAGGRAKVRMTVVPQKSGFLDGFVEFEDDALPEDNRRHFSLFIPENLRILLGPSTALDAAIMKLALRPSGEQGSAAPFAIDAVDRAGFLSAQLARYDAVVVLGAASLPASFFQRLDAYVRDGGGVLLMPDADGNVSAFSASLLPALGIPPAEGIVGTVGGSNAQSGFSSVDYDHPLFRTMFSASDPGKKPGVESPRFVAYLRLRGGEASQAVITTGAGGAFLLDHREGNGRVLVCCVSAHPGWSDLPVKGVFVPLINRSMYYLAAREESVLPVIVGSSIEVRIPPHEASAAVELRPPSGDALRLVPKALPSGQYCTLPSLDQPGVFDITAGATVLRAVPVNLDPAESDMTKVTTKERGDYFRSIGVEQLSVLARDADIRASIAEARFGVELWKYLVVGALLLAALEMLIARDTKKRIAGGVLAGA